MVGGAVASIREFVPALSACAIAGTLQSETSDKVLVGGLCAAGDAGSRYL